MREARENVVLTKTSGVVGEEIQVQVGHRQDHPRSLLKAQIEGKQEEKNGGRLLLHLNFGFWAFGTTRWEQRTRNSCDGGETGKTKGIKRRF